MAEAVASRVDAARARLRFWRRAAPRPGDDRSPEIQDFEELVGELLKKAEIVDKENAGLKDENVRLRERVALLEKQIAGLRGN